MRATPTKASLRKHIALKLEGVTHELIVTQSQEIHSQLMSHRAFQLSKNVGLYLNMPHGEIITNHIIESCFASHKTVYLPKCNYINADGRRNAHLSFLSVTSMDEVNAIQPTGKFNLREPIDGHDVMQSGQLDVLIVPGVAFTLTCERLGHGAGFYDEFLEAYTRKYHKTPYLIGLGLREQLVDDLPMEPHDWRLDEVLIAGTA